MASADPPLEPALPKILRILQEGEAAARASPPNAPRSGMGRLEVRCEVSPEPLRPVLPLRCGLQAETSSAERHAITVAFGEKERARERGAGGQKDIGARPDKQRTCPRGLGTE